MTTQPPIPLPDECREAFEKWYAKSTLLSSRKPIAWQGFKAAWNTRVDTMPDPSSTKCFYCGWREGHAIDCVRPSAEHHGSPDRDWMLAKLEAVFRSHDFFVDAIGDANVHILMEEFEHTIRQHEAAQGDALGLLKEIRDTTPITAQRKRIDALLAAMGDGSATIAPVSEETVQPITPAHCANRFYDPAEIMAIAQIEPQAVGLASINSAAEALANPCFPSCNRAAPHDGACATMGGVSGTAAADGSIPSPFTNNMGDANSLASERSGVVKECGTTSPAKLHFSDCSIYDESGLEIPNGKCNCGGAVEDKAETAWRNTHPDPCEISVVGLMGELDAKAESIEPENDDGWSTGRRMICIGEAMEVFKNHLRTTEPCPDSDMIAWVKNWGVSDENAVGMAHTIEVMLNTAKIKALRTTEPVSVSLETIAEIIEPAFFGKSARHWTPEHAAEMQEKARVKAKAVLESAKEQGAKFDYVG